MSTLCDLAPLAEDPSVLIRLMHTNKWHRTDKRVPELTVTLEGQKCWLLRLVLRAAAADVRVL